MSKPILFLDVDGVLNVWPMQPGAVQVETEHGQTYLPPGTRERLGLLLDAFDPIWSTAWRGVAHAHHREALGLSEASWPYVNYRDLKLTEMIRHAGERPWAWVDDDAQFELDRLHPAFAAIPDSLIVIPDPHIGLTDEHVEQLLEFARLYA